MTAALSSLELEKGLPSDPNAERLILGSILLDGKRFVDVAAEITREDFTLNGHRLVWMRMQDLFERSEEIDRITVANELIRSAELDSAGGLSYLVSLDDGLPHIANLTAYIRILREHTRSRNLAFLGQAITNKALLRMPAAEVIEFGFTRLMALGDTDEKRGLISTASVVESYPGGINAFLSPQNNERGLNTGFTKLDEMTGGLRAKELILLAARPSMGKTALAMQIAEFSARRGTTTAVFSLEMSRESLLQRLVCSRARVDLQRFRGGYLNSDERNRLRLALGGIMDSPLHVDDTSGLGLMELHSKLLRLNAENPVGLVVVDYLQLMEVESGKGSRNDDVSALSRGLKLLAGELDIPLVALSQLSRGPETRPGDHRPRLSDLRESGSLEQDADIVGFVFREEVYKNDREDLRGVAELIVAKQRNGPIGKVDLIFLHNQVRFENRAEDLGDIDGDGAVD